MQFESRIERLKHRAHLLSAAARRVGYVQVGVSGNELCASDLKVNQNADAPADSPFFALEVVFASRKTNYLRIRERMPG